MDTEEIFNSEYLLSSYLLHEKRDTTSLLMNLGYFKPLFLNKADEFLEQILKNRRKILDNSLLKKYPILTKHLINHKIIIQKNKNEEDCFIKPVYKKNEKPYSISVYLLVTQDCNLACVYCLAGRNYKKKVAMTEKIAFETIDLISELVESDGKIEIVFFGGEPILNWNLIKKCVSYIENSVSKKHKDIKYHYHITTNMTLFPDDFVSFVKSHNFTLLTDIDGLQHHHDKLRPTINGNGSYNKIIHNIQKLVDLEVPFSVRTTVTSINENHLAEICSNYRNIGIESCAFPLLIPVNSDQKLVDSTLYPSSIYVSQLKSIIRNKIILPEKMHPVSEFIRNFLNGTINSSGCGMPNGTTLTVDSDGNIYPCIYLAGIEFFRLSNVIDALSDNSKVLNNRFFTDYANNYGINNSEQCKNCLYKYACGGGCPIISLSINTNTEDGRKAEQYFRSAWCATVKTSIQELAWYLAKEGLSNCGFNFPVC